ncbi:MAG: hypothetical protein RL204_81, partial [Bacteroidota bacterium]
MNKIMKTYIIPIIALILFASCGEKTTETAATNETSSSENIVSLTPEQLSNMKIQTASPQLMDVGTFLHLNGKLITPPQD